MSEKEKKFNPLVGAVLVVGLVAAAFYNFNVNRKKQQIEQQVMLANAAYFTALNFKGKSGGLFPLASTSPLGGIGVFDEEIVKAKGADMETWRGSAGNFPMGLMTDLVASPDTKGEILRGLQQQELRYAAVEHSLLIALNGPDGDADIPVSAMPIESVTRKALGLGDFLFLDFPDENVIYDPTNGFTSSGDIVIYDGAEGDLHTWTAPNYKAGFFSKSYAKKHNLDLDKLRQEMLNK